MQEMTGGRLGGGNVPDAKRDPDIVAALHRLNASVDEMQGSFEHLCARLGPISRIEPCEQLDKLTRPGSCPLSQTLLDIAERIDALTHSARMQLSVLEI